MPDSGAVFTALLTRGSETVRSAIDALDKMGRLHWPKKGGGRPSFKRYLADMDGMALQDLILDIPPVRARAKESTKYPTQKPLNLMYRILDASSKHGDLVLDPFCGCASMPVAAVHRGRSWIGIDTWEEAGQMVQDRLHNRETGEWFFDPERQYLDCIADPSKLPRRGDVGEYRKGSRADRERLWLEQGEKCGLPMCERRRDNPDVTWHVDRIIPGDHGPTSYVFGNVQWLCAEHNMMKGNRPMDYLMRQVAQAEFSFPAA